MKKWAVVWLCVVGVLAFLPWAAGCAVDAPSGASPEASAPPNAETDAPLGDESVADGTAAQETAADTDDSSLYVAIRTPEDLMAFNAAVNNPADETDFSFMTVVFLSDLDMSGYIWTPLDGAWLEQVTFDGRGHTISHLTLADHALPADSAADAQGAGFIGVSHFGVTFRDLTFAHMRVTAYASCVGGIIGTNAAPAGAVRFENVHIKDFTVDGWMDLGNQAAETGGHPVATCIGGFIGRNTGGSPRFTDCTVEDLALSGFHSLGGFVGSDAGGALTADAFSGCAVRSAELTFSYSLADSYINGPVAGLVSVFYCASDGADTAAAVAAAGNSFSHVTYYDYADDLCAYPAESADSREAASAAVESPPANPSSENAYE